MSRRFVIGIIGCGVISESYIARLASSDRVTVAACADLNAARSTELANRYGLVARSTSELFDDREIDIVLNLTNPVAHAAITLDALRFGHHVYSEKPYVVDELQAATVASVAESTGRVVASAPDTFLQPNIQAAVDFLDAGGIGEVVAGHVFYHSHGHESWHPNPDFYYKKGGGPLFDMGPYYVAALISLIGPAANVTGTAKRSFSRRVITSAGVRSGDFIDVEVSTHYSGVLEFFNGAQISLTASFDAWPTDLPDLELYGTSGTLRIPRSGIISGEVKAVTRNSGDSWHSVDQSVVRDTKFGSGLIEMALALEAGREPRTGLEVANHVLDVLRCFDESARTGNRIHTKTTCRRPTSLDQNERMELWK